MACDVQDVPVRLPGEREDHPLDVEHLDERLEVLDAAEQLLAVLSLPGVDEADDTQAVLRVLTDLAREQRPDLACADDDRVLEVADAPVAERPGRHPEQRDQGNRECPEERQPLDARRREVGQVHRREEQPGPRGDEVEDPDQVVRGRVVGALLVVVVEALQLGRDDEERQREDEEPDLDRGLEAVVRVTGQRELCDHECDHQAEQVGR